MSGGLSIVVPVYNEKDAVSAAAERLCALGAAEVIFVDDGSDDGTSETLAALDGKGIRVIRHRVNRGYGAALKTGIAAAQGEFVAITDADGTYPDGRLPQMHREAVEGDLDMVVGARDRAGIPLVRRPAKWVLGRIANVLSGRRIPDLNSGLRVMRKSSVERFRGILPDGFSFTTTITLAMLTSGLAVSFTPIAYGNRIGRSKIRPVYDTLNFLQLICRTVLYFNPLRIFIPLSLSLVAMSALVLALSWLFADRIMDVTVGVLFMTAVFVLAIGLLADLIDKRLQ
jgi:glycosyltransferase involved in cell wall biosynthesis